MDIPTFSSSGLFRFLGGSGGDFCFFLCGWGLGFSFSCSLRGGGSGKWLSTSSGGWGSRGGGII